MAKTLGTVFGLWLLADRRLHGAKNTHDQKDYCPQEYQIHGYTICATTPSTAPRRQAQYYSSTQRAKSVRCRESDHSGEQDEPRKKQPYGVPNRPETEPIRNQLLMSPVSTSVPRRSSHRRRKPRLRISHTRLASLRTAIVRNAMSRINPISVTSRRSTSAFATIASSRQHRSASGGASRIHRAVRKTTSAHLSRCRAMTLCNRYVTSLARSRPRARSTA